MGQRTRQEVLAQMRRRYVRAGRKYKAQLLDQAVELFGYHRKAAIRALRASSAAARPPFVRDRPKTYDSDRLLPTLKLQAKQRVGRKVVRQYGPVQIPLARLLAWVEVSEATKARLGPERAGLNAFGVRRGSAP